MPYIPDLNRREQLKQTLDPINGGELNFTLYYLSLKYLDRVGKSYGKCEEIIDVLEEMISYTDFYPRYGNNDVSVDPINRHELHDLFYNVISTYVKRTNKRPWGTLRANQLEVYRRLIGPYEDEKIEENGDVTVKKTTKQGHLKDPIY